MAERSEDDGDKKAALPGGEDHISALPDALLQQVLSLLPSREAVRTCVLATRWRTLWKSVPSVRINTAGEIYSNPQALSKFANHLLLLRDRTPLHECEINSYYGGDSDEAFRYIELWLRYAVSCQVRVLRVHVKNELKDLCLSNVSLPTQHLTWLELCSIEVGGHFLDFSRCPALKVLKMEHCTINAERILSQSLSHLSIYYGTFMSDGHGRTRISAPSLITLELDEFTGYTPLLEPMPSLIMTFLRFGENCHDHCHNYNFFGDCGSQSCGGCSYSQYYDNDDCVLLEGLSGTKNLELISQSELLWGINAERISSQSLSHLIIYYGSFMSGGHGRTRISAPSLITLELDEFMGYTPLLEPMPSLIRAFLRFGENCHDHCHNYNYFGDCGSQLCGGCSYSKYYDNDNCVLLDGLSGTKNLELISQSELFIGRMDFKWRVMFSQLKTLLLSEWCMAADFSGLIYFVQHSPILERLTLQLKYYEEESMYETEESYNPRSRFLVSKHLKVVEIKCRKEDETIHQIVKILGTHGVPPERINIKPNFHDYGLGCFSFE